MWPSPAEWRVWVAYSWSVMRTMKHRLAHAVAAVLSAVLALGSSSEVSSSNAAADPTTRESSPSLSTPAPSTAPTTRRWRRTAERFELGSGATTRPLPVGTFNALRFAHTRPTEVVFRTPGLGQLLVYGRPAPATRPAEGETRDLPRRIPTASLPPALRYGGADLRWFAFRDEAGQWVPGLIATPPGRDGPFPMVLATHGLLSHKVQVLGQVGESLLARGFAVVAIDLPLHGERPGMPLTIVDPKDPQRMADLWHDAVLDLRQALDVATSLELIDADQPVTLLGYSLGSWMSTLTAAADPRASALVLMVGGATEIGPELLAVKDFASSDPRAAIAAYAPRPLLMVNARNDRTVTPVMAGRLFDAAREPKEQRWYDQGHILREPAYTETADWIDATRARLAPTTRPGG